MASSVVIKVKYEDTLRRFSVPVDGDQRLDLTMESLRLKISSLFNLPPNAKFNLTYKDEDDDLVTLVDDEDLHDVVRQGLNPVRITVHLKTDKSDNTCAVSSKSSMPSGSSSQNSQQNVNPSVAEFLKAVPEPLRHAFSKLSLELASKAASTSPIAADLVDGFSKMGQSHLNVSHSHSHSCTANVSRHDEVCENPKNNTSSGNLETSIDEERKHNETQTLNSVQPAPKSTQATGVAEPSRPPMSPPFLFHNGKNANPGPFSYKLSTGDGTKKDKETEDSAGKSDIDVRSSNYSKANLKKHVSSCKEASENTPCDDRRFQFVGSSTKSYFDSSTFCECPFSGVPVPTDQMFLRDQLSNKHPIQPSNRRSSKADGIGSIFHKGVRCDGCGVVPIAGPRFKSNVKHDYDLCSICFGRMGNDVDYTRIDFPLPYRHPWSFKKVTRVPPVQVPYMMRPPAMKHLRSRLDSRFIMDVNVMDGTLMAPLTPFTKIWRMRNNGSLPWLRGLQLLWIGGDRFSASDSVDIEIPIDGVNISNEIDMAVDFIAPQLPGRYISYWRMAEPSGRKFGQRVWVLIQVDASVDLLHESTPWLNLNFPPESSGNSGAQILDVNVEPALDFETGNTTSPSLAEKIEIEDLNFPINDDVLVASNVSCPTSAAASTSAPPAVGCDNPVSPPASSVSYAGVDASAYHKPLATPLSTSYPIIDVFEGYSPASTVENDKRNPERDSGENRVEKILPMELALLKELEQMGFKEVDLNKKVLRMNEYDLERSVDDLCGVSEWDPILNELREMGFEDKETNKKLLTKNNGSITRVVMDLISGEKAE